jgi:Glycosyltransferase family 10 (fucosyltransferase) C-term
MCLCVYVCVCVCVCLLHVYMCVCMCVFLFVCVCVYYVVHLGHETVHKFSPSPKAVISYHDFGYAPVQPLLSVFLLRFHILHSGNTLTPDPNTHTVLFSSYCTPVLHRAGSDPVVVVVVHRNIKEMAAYLRYLDRNHTAYEEHLAWKYEGWSDDFQAMLDLGSTHGTCRECVYVADMHRRVVGDPHPSVRPFPLEHPSFIPALHSDGIGRNWGVVCACVCTGGCGLFLCIVVCVCVCVCVCVWCAVTIRVWGVCISECVCSVACLCICVFHIL